MSLEHFRPGDAERFWRHVDKTPTCWLWTGGDNGYGYGRFSVRTPRGPRSARAHRIAFVLAGGTIPDDKVLDHICRVRRCVNPEHLRLLTNAENVLIGISFSAINARKTHCPQDHPYNEVNTYINYLGYRRCRLCLAEQRRGQRARNPRNRARRALPAAPTGEGETDG